MDTFRPCNDVKLSDDFTVNSDNIKPKDSIPAGGLFHCNVLKNTNDENFPNDPFCNGSFYKRN